MTDRPLARSKAFTFIELIVATTIFAVIAVSIYSTFNAGIKMWMKTSPMIESNQSARLFLNAISLDLRNAIAYYPEADNAIKTKFGGEYEGDKNFEGSKDRISFITIISVTPADSPSREEPARVSYLYDKQSKTVKRLVAAKSEGLKEESAKAQDMLTGVEEKDFGFEYCYKTMASGKSYECEWRDAWEDKNVMKIPRGVRIKAAGIRKTVFIPTGTLGEGI